MKLKRFLLRYYPPGIILEYTLRSENGSGEQKTRTKSIDLIDLNPDTDIDQVVTEIIQREPLISPSRADQIRSLVERLQVRISESYFILSIMRKLQGINTY